MGGIDETLAMSMSYAQTSDILFAGVGHLGESGCQKRKKKVSVTTEFPTSSG